MRRSVRAVAAACAVVALAAAGCATFDESAASPFTPAPSDRLGGDINPEQTPPERSAEPPTGPLGPCDDPDPAVIATCLDVLGGLVVLPDGKSALVAERATGRILDVAPDREPREWAALEVDGSGDGGLLDLALSPSYPEDKLVYAYITTAVDNRVVRIAKGDAPKPVLTGIPRGGWANRGSLEFSGRDELMVLTSDAGDPGAARDPGSLAGKLLKVTHLQTGETNPFPEVMVSGIGIAGGVCVGNKAVWVTDRVALEDRLQRVDDDGAVSGSPVWTWPDRPGVGACAARGDSLAIALAGGKAMAGLDIETDGEVTSEPSLYAVDRFGALEGAAVGPDGTLWASTTNKGTPDPIPTDDRVVLIPFRGGGGGEPD